MKKLIVIVTIILATILSLNSLKAQGMKGDSIYIVPENPTTSDTVFMVSEIWRATNYVMVSMDVEIIENEVVVNGYCIDSIPWNGPIIWTTKKDTAEIGFLEQGYYYLYFIYEFENSDGEVFTTTFSKEFDVSDENAIGYPNTKEISLYPNPAKETAQIQKDKTIEITHIKLYNVFGKTVRNFNSPDTKIDLSGIKQGQYILCIKTGKRTYYKKLMIL